MDPDILAAIASAVLTLFGAGASAYSERPHDQKLGSENGPDIPEDPVKETRLAELHEALAIQRSVGRLNGWADSLLTFGQYIVGGLLASSFIQDSLPNPVIGGLGILVLLSSLIRQRYRPDLKSVGAKRRTIAIRALIREVEDHLYALNQGQEGAPSVYAIRQRVSACLAALEESELADIPQDGELTIPQSSVLSALPPEPNSAEE